jgi:hypothetical protein
MGALALFLVLTGGTAFALDGSNTVFSDDIVNNEVKTADIRDANVTMADLRPASVNSSKVVDESLTGADIGPNAVASGEIQNLVRGVSLPLASFVNKDDDTTLDFSASNGTSPDFAFLGSSTFVIEWDADTDGGGTDVADTDEVTSGLTIPPDWVPGGQLSFALRASKSGHSGVDERFQCFLHDDNGNLFGLPSTVTTSASRTTYVFDADESAVFNAAPGDAVQLICAVDDGSFNGSTANDAVFLHGVEFRYTAAQ